MALDLPGKAETTCGGGKDALGKGGREQRRGVNESKEERLAGRGER